MSHIMTLLKLFKCGELIYLFIFWTALNNMITLLQTSAGNASESADDDKILYASVQSHKKNKDTKKPEEDEIQYASVTVHQPATEAK